jgi:acylphosphatase
MQKTIHFYVSGRVQGVIFRQRTKEQADLFGVTGWVRNRSDGRVEGMAQGSDPALASLREWLKRGPPRAKVVDLDWQEAEAGKFTTFEITM